MRLTDYEVKSIKESVKNFFGEAAIVYVFGSRVDDQQKGGDIDLYIIPQDMEGLFMKKMHFLVDLELRIGEQKVDVVLPAFNAKGDPEHRLIDSIAKEQGVRL